MKIEVTTPPPPQPPKRWGTADMKFAVACQRISITYIQAMFDGHGAAKDFVAGCPGDLWCDKIIVNLESGLEEKFCWYESTGKWVLST